MRVFLVQSDAVLGDIAKNREYHARLIAAAIKKKSDIVLFPELSLSGYLLEDRVKDIALTPREVAAFFDGMLPEKMTVGIGFPERARNAVYNSYAIIQGGHKAKVLGVQRKINLPTYGMFDESRHFRAGERLERLTLPDGTTAAILICEDAWHPALPAALAASPEGTPHLFVVPAASPSRGYRGKRPSNLEGWEHIAEHFSRVYGVGVLVTQRVGVEDSLIFAGGSIAVDHHGKRSRAPLFRETILTVEIETDIISRTLAKTAVVSVSDRAILKKTLE